MVTEDCGRKISHTSKEIMSKLFLFSKEIDSLIILLNGNVSMPLTSPSPRKSLHDREISCTGFHRSDGLWDIEGRLTDKKNYSFEKYKSGWVEIMDNMFEKNGSWKTRKNYKSWEQVEV